MKHLKPSWVSHEGKPIFSVDIHPDGTRFATGGMGPNIGMLAIWNMAPLLNEEYEKNGNIPKLLFQIDQGCVNVVRWSHSGMYLATGEDDHVTIWQKSDRPGDAVFGSNGVNVENWKSISCLRGHTGDVLDLAWSHCDNLLATGSIDNSIFIWNTQKWQEITAILRGHTSMVKGVAWDPMGQYLASQSDDKSLRVWRTKDWQVEVVLTEPFANCTNLTHILRPGWSPDGLHLVAANAMDNSSFTAKIVERDGWKTDKDFMGHLQPITCVRFNPNMLSNAKNEHFYCCAIGSNDRSISIWLSNLKRPRVVMENFLTNSILDISWNQQGSQMIACSYDGSIACMNFPEEELGRAITDEGKYYGKNVVNNLAASSDLIDGRELLKLQQQQQEEEALQTSTAEIKSFNSSRPPSQMKGAINMQKETPMKDGRRRITPFSIPTDKNNGSNYKSDISMPLKSVANCQITSPQISNQVDQKNSPKPAIIDVGTQENLLQASATSDGPTAASALVKRKLDQLQGKQKLPRTLNSTTPHSDDSEDSSNVHLPAPRIHQTSCLHLSGIEYRALEIENGILLQPSVQVHRLRCVDSASGTTLWEIVFSSRISLVDSSSSQIAVCCEDGTLSLVSPRGGRLKPPIVLMGQASFLSCYNHLVLVATTHAVLSLWDFKNNISIIKNVSILPILQRSSNCQVRSLRLTQKGLPIITLSTGNVYTYDNQLSAWIQVGSDLLSSKIQSLTDSCDPLTIAQSQSKTDNEMTLPCNLSFLESQMALTEALGLQKEFHYWFTSLVRSLVKKDMELRIRDICSDLLGSTDYWSPQILGLKKHELLKEVLQIIASNVKLQNLYMEYKNKLEQL
ncbi:HIRA [Cordylochernes scorpioides]|uniref:Protein HIRA n=1 Tax=Cordylochernes scorpioides TaxID=51811 RepID=A0ABY6LIY1_9ARAC|nr:HIRA [Cordylochernes scorpioides]